MGLGEGAGANILARCGLAHPRRLLGLILVNCTASTSSVADAFRTRFSRWRGADISQSEEDFLIYHKFGHVSFVVEADCRFSYQVVFLRFLLFANFTNFGIGCWERARLGMRIHFCSSGSVFDLSEGIISVLCRCYGNLWRDFTCPMHITTHYDTPQHTGHVKSPLYIPIELITFLMRQDRS